MKKISVYEKPACTSCRKVVKALQEQGIDFQKVNYYIEPFSKAKLKSLLKKMRMKPTEIIRSKENIFKELNIRDSNYSDEELIDLMIKHPDLIQRPIVEMGDKAILARPPERVKELFI